MSDPILSPEEHASILASIRQEGIALLDLLDDAKSAMLDVAPVGAFVSVRPMQEAVLGVWLEANHYQVIEPGGLGIADAEALRALSRALAKHGMFVPPSVLGQAFEDVRGEAG